MSRFNIEVSNSYKGTSEKQDQDEIVEQNALLKEVLQEIKDKDLNLEQAKKFYKIMWKVIDKYMDEGKKVLIPLQSSVSVEHHPSKLSVIYKKKPLQSLNIDDFPLSSLRRLISKASKAEEVKKPPWRLPPPPPK